MEWLEATIGNDGFSMVVHHWSDDGMVKYHRTGLVMSHISCCVYNHCTAMLSLSLISYIQIVQHNAMMSRPESQPMLTFHTCLEGRGHPGVYGGVVSQISTIRPMCGSAILKYVETKCKLQTGVKRHKSSRVDVDIDQMLYLGTAGYRLGKGHHPPLLHFRKYKYCTYTIQNVHSVPIVHCISVLCI